MRKYGPWIIALILTWFAARQYYTWVPGLPAKVCTKDSTVTYYDTIPYLDTTRPAIVKSEPVPQPAVIDSAAVVAAFYTRNTYRDSLTFGDVKIKVDYDLLGNALEGTRWQVVNLRPTEQHYYSPGINHRVAGGLVAGVNLVAPSISYSFKRWRFTGSYNLVQSEFSPAFLVGVQYTFLEW